MQPRRKEAARPSSGGPTQPADSTDLAAVFSHGGIHANKGSDLVKVECARLHVKRHEMQASATTNPHMRMKPRGNQASLQSTRHTWLLANSVDCIA
jgi:hypothetical protein